MYKSPGNESGDILPEDPAKDPWEGNQPPPWQWALIAGIAVVMLCALAALVTLAFRTYNTWTENRTHSTAQVITRATAEVQKGLDVIQEAQSWPILLVDSFNDNANEWKEGEIDDEYVSMTLTLDSRYIWNVTSKKGVVWRVWPRSDILSDFYLAVDVQNLGRNQSTQSGLIVHNNEDAYCYLEVSDDGYYRVSSYDGQNWLDLVPVTYSEIIRPEEVNHLEIAIRDDIIYFRINNQLVGSATGCSQSRGQAGVAISLNSANEHAMIAFDNFELRTPGATK
jgi:hypothetical protein